MDVQNEDQLPSDPPKDPISPIIHYGANHDCPNDCSKTDSSRARTQDRPIEATRDDPRFQNLDNHRASDIRDNCNLSNVICGAADGARKEEAIAEQRDFHFPT